VAQRPRQQRHADMKVAILKAARDAILEHGPEHFSLRDVARRSGFSPAGLYEYFSGKEDLVAAVAEESLAQLYAVLAYAGRSLPPEERLVALGLAYIRFAHENPQHFMLIFARLPSQRVSPEQAPRPTSPYQVVLHTVQDGVDTGVFVVCPGFGVEEMAYGLWVMAHGMAMLQQTHLRQFQADSAAHDRRVLEVYVHGLRQE
jgi:AcrR family transcriptional regulator